MTLIFAVYFINFEEKRVRRSLFDQLLIETRLIDANITEYAQIEDSQKLKSIISRMAKIARVRVTIVNIDGKVLADSVHDYRKMENHLNRPEIRKALTGTEQIIYRFSNTLQQKLIYVAYPLRIDDKIVGVVRVARDQRDLDHILLRLRSLIIGGILLAAIVPILIGIVAMNRMTRPVLELKQIATAISSGDLSVRVHYFGRDELAELGLAFNNMAQRLSDSFTMLRDEKHKLQVILENLLDGILVIDRNLNIILANPSAQKILGFNARNIEGRPILEVVLNHHLLELIQEVNRVKDVFESELTLHYPKNNQIQVFLAPLKDETGLLVGSIVVLHDLTLLRRLERVRQDFVANVSHELRTPITSIKAMAETLLRGAWQDPDVSLRYLNAIDQESDRLTFLINDLLALAKLDSRTSVTKEPVDLVNLIKEVSERFEPLSRKKPNFEINLSGDTIPKIDVNRDQIKQVLINLLDNAFKYTLPDGQIRLSAWVEGDMVKVAVADTGIGIPQEDLTRIFERFYRVDKARSREVGGTGLGLSIVKNIVESHGGKVEVESSLNKGSVFSFTVPMVKE